MVMVVMRGSLRALRRPVGVGVVVVDAVAGEGEEHLVERRLLHAHLGEVDARLAERDEQVGDAVGVAASAR